MAEELVEPREADDLPETIYDYEVDVVNEAFTVNLPDEILEAHGFEGSFLLAFEPTIVHNDLTGHDEIEFIVRRVEPSDVGLGGSDKEIQRRRHVMRMWASSDTRGVTFPREFVDSIRVESYSEGYKSLWNVARSGDLRVDIESLDTGVFRFAFQPSALTWEIPDDGGMDVFDYEPDPSEQETEWPVTKTLISTNSSGSTYQSVRLEFPSSFKRKDTLWLKSDQKVATRLASRDGEPVLVLDFDVGEAEEDERHVRTIVLSKSTGQARVQFSQPWLYGLGWDTDTELSIEPGTDRVLVSRADE